MCNDSSLLINVNNATHPIPIKLPDGSTKYVSHFGSVCISSKLVLHDVLFTPYFKFNVLSINKLCAAGNIRCTFYYNYCTLQDQKTEVLLAKGKVLGSLYILDKFAFVANDKCNNFDCNMFLGDKNSTCKTATADMNFSCKIATTDMNSSCKISDASVNVNSAITNKSSYRQF